MAEQDVAQFLTHLARDLNVAPSTQNQALSALLFLYKEVLKHEIGWLEKVERAKKPPKLPVVLSRGEVQRVFAHLHGTPKLMAGLLYGSGLRLMECVRLRVHPVRYSLERRCSRVILFIDQASNREWHVIAMCMFFGLSLIIGFTLG